MRKGLAFLLAVILCAGAFASAFAEKKITITFTGDVTLGSEETKKNKPESFNGYAAREGYDYFFRNFREMFAADDLTVINLEGVLSDSNRQENTKKTYRFRGPAEYAEILVRSSIEACGISNNHTKDFGKQGYNATRDALTKYGVGYFGAKEYYIFEKDGIKIAFFALVSPIVQGSREWAGELTERLRKEEGVNAVVLCIHAGQEYDPHHNITQKNYAELAFKYFGADLVIMHHPHVLQGVEIQNNRYVCYSLGNFCFGGNTKIRSLETMVVQADLYFEDSGAYKGQQLRLYPAHIASSAKEPGDENDFLPRLVTGDEAMAVLQLVQNDTDYELGTFDEDTGYLALQYLPAEAEKTADPAE